MKMKKNNNESKLYIGVPKVYIKSNLKEIDPRLTPTFFIIYCLIDEYRTWYSDISYYKTSVLNIMEDMGKPFDFNSKSRRLPNLSNEIISNLEYMEEAGMITTIKGDYHNPWHQFEIKINDDFIFEECVDLDVSHFKFVMDYGANMNKGKLLHVLLYTLSTYIRNARKDNDTNRTWYEYVQVYSESNNQTSKKIGISDKTIGKCLQYLSGDGEDNKPLVIYHTRNIFDKELKEFVGIPNIYTENSAGYSERINIELKYFQTIKGKNN